jgi:hypothetical protein
MIIGTPIVRCDGCGAVVFAAIVPGKLYEGSTFYANLRRTRPLREGGQVRLGERVLDIREAPGFCSKACFEKVTETPGEFVSSLVPSEGPWREFKGWEYRVRWDNREGTHAEPPDAPSAVMNAMWVEGHKPS